MEIKANEKCPIHRTSYEYACLHPMCRGFKLLCQQEFQEHTDFHQQNTMQNEPEPKNFIKTMKEMRAHVRQTLLKVREELEKLHDQAFTEIKIAFDEETNIDRIVKDLEGIKTHIVREFDNFIENLRQSFEQPIKEKIHKAYQEIEYKLQKTQNMIKESESLDIMRQIATADIGSQVQYQRLKLDQLIHQRKNLTFEGEIDDDVALRFNGNFKKELENLIVYKDKLLQRHPKKKANKRSNAIEIFESSTALNQLLQLYEVNFCIKIQITSPESRLKNCLYYIDQKSAKIHLFDIEKNTTKSYDLELSTKFNNQNAVHKLSLEFDFFSAHNQQNGGSLNGGNGVGGSQNAIKLFPNYRSVLANNGVIYLFGGYDAAQMQQREDSEDQFKQILKIEYDKLTDRFTLKPTDAKLATLRHSAGVCLLGSQIYVIGGFNYKEGVLNKCERITVGGDKIEGGNQQKELRVQPIQSLKIATSHSCCTQFQEKALFKFGGIEYYGEPLRQPNVVSRQLEIYSVQFDIWQPVELQMENTPLIPFYCGACLQVNEEQILIFGGRTETENGELTEQSFLITVQLEGEEEAAASDNIKIELEFDLTVSRLAAPAFVTTTPIIIAKQVCAIVFEKKSLEHIEVNMNPSQSKALSGGAGEPFRKSTVEVRNPKLLSDAQGKDKQAKQELYDSDKKIDSQANQELYEQKQVIFKGSGGWRYI